MAPPRHVPRACDRSVAAEGEPRTPRTLRRDEGSASLVVAEVAGSRQLLRIFGQQRLGEAFNSFLVVRRNSAKFLGRQRSERPGDGPVVTRQAHRTHCRCFWIQAGIQQLPGLEPEDTCQLEEHVSSRRRLHSLDAGDSGLRDASLGRKPQKMDFTPVMLHEGSEISPDDAGWTELVHGVQVCR